MRGLKLNERCKNSQVHALNSSETITSRNPKAMLNKNGFKSFGSKLKSTNSLSAIEDLQFHLPTTDILEPTIEPYLKPINLVESLADLYRRLESCPQSEKTLLFVEQYSLLRCLGDQKLLRRCLRTA